MSVQFGDPRLPVYFWGKIELGAPPAHKPELGPCWVWTRAKNSRGYGAFAVNGKSRSVHRIVHETFIGPIPEGLTIDHLCRVKPCANPGHIEAVTQAENNRRKPASLVTECPQGHPYDEENTRLNRGRRNCRECDRIRQRVPEGQRRRSIRPDDRRLVANRGLPRPEPMTIEELQATYAVFGGAA